MLNRKYPRNVLYADILRNFRVFRWGWHLPVTMEIALALLPRAHLRVEGIAC